MNITAHIDNVTKMSSEYLHSFCPAPKSVKIELSPRCNFRCGFCALRTRKEQPIADMDYSFFQRITSEMKDAGVKEIGCFFLGESMMNPELLIKAIKWCKQDLKFSYIFLTTNASLAYPEVIKNCMEAGLDSLKFSVNAHSEKQFEQIMGVNKKLYHRALENIKKTHEIREKHSLKCGLYASSIFYDEEQRKNIQSVLNKYILPFVDEHYWLPLYSMGSFATQREEELGYKPIAGNQGRLGALREPLPCWSAFTEGHVRADGGLSACCFDAEGKWLMGDLNKTSFMEAWNSRKFQELRKAHINKDVIGTICEQCVAYA